MLETITMIFVMKYRVRHIALLLLAALFFGLAPASLAQSGGTSAPFGFLQLNLTPSSDGTSRAFSAVAIPLHQTPIYVGLVGAVSGNTVTFSGTIPSGLTAAPYMMHVESGSNSVATGQTFLITAAGSNSITVSTPTVALSSLLTQNDEVAIRGAETLGSIFGSTDSTVLLQSGTSAGSADVVYVWNGSGYDSYYYQTSYGWVQDGDASFTVQNNLPIYPDEAVLVGRISTDTLPASYMSCVGMAPTNAQKALVNAPGLTLVSNPLPTPVTLSQFGFTNSPSWREGQSAGGSDQVYLFNGGRWKAYYYLSSYGWVQDGDPTFALQSNTQIPAGSGVLVLRRSSLTAANAYIPIPLNYSLN
jgi:uncharacterized protein (TIGR02597 family)